MRIVSWNKQKKKLATGQFAEMLRAVKADVLVMQEASGCPGATGWTFVPLPGLGAQDTYAIGVRPGGAIKYSMSLSDPRGVDGAGARKWAVAKVTVDGESITIATCHAPHDHGKETESSEAALDYMRALGGKLGMTFKRPGPYLNANFKKDDRGQQDPTRPKDPNKQVAADLFMGDTNLYEPEVAGGDQWLPLGWGSAHVGCTTGHRGNGHGGSWLDRIAYRKNSTAFKDKKLVYGRIRARETKLGRMPDGAEDFLVPEPKNEYAKFDPTADWTSADHLAIYLDVVREDVQADEDGPEAMDLSPIVRQAPPPPAPGLNLRTRVVAPPPEKKGRTGKE